MITKKWILFLSLILTLQAWADKDINDSKLTIKAADKVLKFSGYFDGYYAHDFSNPIDGDKDLEKEGGGRQFTSNPLYDQQFSIGYSYIQTEFEAADNVVFRFALHFGDIVQKMYYEEPERYKNIREASATIKFSDRLKMEVGFMPSIFGFETFINKDNMHATRSYMNDFAPDFDAGVRFYYRMDKWSLFKFQVTNGWQVERDKNKNKALGLAYVYDHPGRIHFNWGQFIGDEAPSGNVSNIRYYNNIYAKIWLTDRWILAPVLDIGWEQRGTKEHKSWAPWQSYGLSARYALTSQHGLAARYDRTFDPNSIIPELHTGTKHGWNSNGYTLTYEYLFSEFATFRLEGRYVKSRDAVFKTKKTGGLINEDSFVYSSLALSF